MAGSDKTEKATPKKREEARNKGQVAKSADLNGAIVLLVGLFTLAATGPGIVAHCKDAMHDMLTLGAVAPDVVQRASIGAVILDVAKEVGLSVAPVAFACCLAGVVANVAQVRFRITPKALKPDPSKLNPVSGFKQIFGPNALVEGVKSVVEGRHRRRHRGRRAHPGAARARRARRHEPPRSSARSSRTRSSASPSAPRSLIC